MSTKNWAHGMLLVYVILFSLLLSTIATKGWINGTAKSRVSWPSANGYYDCDFEGDQTQGYYAALSAAHWKGKESCYTNYIVACIDNQKTSTTCRGETVVVQVVQMCRDPGVCEFDIELNNNAFEKITYSWLDTVISVAYQKLPDS